MSAHKLFCYGPQRHVVTDFLQEVGAVITRDSPHVITSADQLQGATHISFMAVTGMNLPADIRRMLAERGALMIMIDDSYERLHVQDAIAARERRRTIKEQA